MTNGAMEWQCDTRWRGSVEKATYVAERVKNLTIWAEVFIEKNQLFDLRPDLPHT